jgi:hypothetical protein
VGYLLSNGEEGTSRNFEDLQARYYFQILEKKLYKNF